MRLFNSFNVFTLLQRFTIKNVFTCLQRCNVVTVKNVFFPFLSITTTTTIYTYYLFIIYLIRIGNHGISFYIFLTEKFRKLGKFDMYFLTENSINLMYFLTENSGRF